MLVRATWTKERCETRKMETNSKKKRKLQNQTPGIHSRQVVAPPPPDGEGEEDERMSTPGSANAGEGHSDDPPFDSD